MVQSQVLEAKVFHSPYGTGVAIVTGSSRFTLATNIEDLKLRRLPEVPGKNVSVVLVMSRLTSEDKKRCPSLVSDIHLPLELTCLCLCPSFDSVPLGLQGKPSSWVVLTQDRQTKVLLSIGPELYVLDNTSCTAVVRQTR